MQANKLARQLSLLKRDRRSGYRERVTVRPQVHVICESIQERKWWEDFTEALEKGHLKPTEFSLRDLFESLVPEGREMVRLFNPQCQMQGRELREAADAVSTSDFSNITGQIVYSMMMQDLPEEELKFTSLIPTQSTPYDGEKIPGIAGLGDVAETVAEGEEYPFVKTGEDYIETPQTTKRGFIVPVTKEAIFFDRTGELQQKCSRVGYWLAVNKEKRAIDCIIDGNTTAHRYKWRGYTYATYQTATPWDNVTASNELVDWTDVDAVHQTANAVTDPNTGEPVTFELKQLICANSLELAALRIRNATEIVMHVGGYPTTGNISDTKAPNPFGGAFDVLTSRQFSARLYAAETAYTSWFMGDVARYARYMENWPITTTEAGAGSYDDFRRDIVAQYRCSERGQYAVIEPRAMQKSTA